MLFRGCAFLISVSALVMATACDRKPAAVSKPATTIPVALAPTRTQAVQRLVTTSGTLFGDEDVQISNKVAGKVVAVYKDVGDRVFPGEPLAQLLKNDYEQDRRKAESALQESLWKLGLSELPSPDFDVATLPAVRRAALQADNAEAKFNRGKQLHDQVPPLMSDQEFADLSTALAVAKANQDVEILNAKGQIADSRSRATELDLATQALADTTIRAPRLQYSVPPPAGQMKTDSEGSATDSVINPNSAEAVFVVATRMASVGELEKAITPMFRLVADNPLKLRAQVPERHVAEVKINQTVKLSVAAYRQDFTGHIARINPQIDPANRTFQVEVLVPNPKHELKPGGFAQAKIFTRLDEAVVFVPIESIITFAGEHKVFTVHNNQAQEHTIHLGTRDGSWIEATQGIGPGELVVVEGATKLANGVYVQPKTLAASPSSAAASPTTRQATAQE